MSEQYSGEDYAIVHGKNGVGAKLISRETAMKELGETVARAFKIDKIKIQKAFESAGYNVFHPEWKIFLNKHHVDDFEVDFVHAYIIKEQ